MLLVSLWSFSSEAATREQIWEMISSRQWEKAYRTAHDDGDVFTRSLATWYYLLRTDIIPDVRLYQSFVKKHPDWPKKGQMKERMEIAFLNMPPTVKELKAWFKQHPPMTSRGTLLLLDAYGKLTSPHLDTLWIESDFALEEERRILSEYRTELSASVHAKRAYRLLWSNQTKAVERMIPLLSSGARKLVRARLALQHNSVGVDTHVNAVPSKFAQRSGLLYDRIRFRAKRGDYKGVEELLLKAPPRLTHADKWWKYQKRVIRDAIEQKQYMTARLLLDKHSQIRPVPRVEAEWLRGWLYFEFLSKPDVAAVAFENIYYTAKMPISRSRGSYWAARAHEASGSKAKSLQWYRQAALFPTTFFGQLAHQHLHPGTPLPLPAFIPPSNDNLNEFVNQEKLAAQFKHMAPSGHAFLVWPHIIHSFKKHTSPEYFARFAALARSVKEYPTAINIAKEAQKKGLYLSDLFPVVTVPNTLAVDPALALAVARQESRFDPKARSSADARGLMQLLPSTAKRVASRHNIPYNINSLYEPPYNMVLGSHYMHGLLQRFRGSHILSIAGYNAGPGRSDQWLERFGTLSRERYRHNVQWTEMIPFAETRNYVQRVLENYHVYRHILSSGKSPLIAREVLTVMQ